MGRGGKRKKLFSAEIQRLNRAEVMQGSNILYISDIARCLYDLLGRGAFVRVHNDPGFYLMPDDCAKTPEIHKLMTTYDPQKEWVLVDATLEVLASQILPLSNKSFRLPSKLESPKEAAMVMAACNEEIKAYHARKWVSQ